MTYEHRIGAFFAACILAGESRLPGLAPDALGAQIWMQSDEPLDDVKVVDAYGGPLLIQAKRTLEVSPKPGSEFAKVCDQLARAHFESDPRARLAVTVGRDASGRIRRQLREILTRAREQPVDAAPRHLVVSEAEKSLYECLVAQLRRAAHSHGQPHAARDLRAILRRTEVLELDVDSGGLDERQAIRALERDVVRDPRDAPAAWSALLEICAELARRSSHLDRSGLQAALHARQIALREPPDVRAEIAALQARSTEHLAYLRSRASITLAGRAVKLDRSISAALAQRVRNVSVAVVGDAGSGKTGCTCAAIARLLEDGIEVVVIAAELIQASTDMTLAAELRISRPLDELLASWPVDRGVMVVDGLDAARDDATRQALVRLIERVATTNARFTVLTSVRTFDLGNSVRLEHALPARPDADESLRRDAFRQTEHIFIPPLDDEELSQLRTAAPTLAAVLDGATAAVKTLARVPFNLSLLAGLVDDEGARSEQLADIETQAALLETYWQRHIRDSPSGDDREYLLRQACEAMVTAGRLYADRRELQAPSNHALRELLHDHVLVQDAAPGRDAIAFSHNLLFDYAVSRLLFRDETGSLQQRLVAEPRLLLAQRPALELHFRWLWDQGSARNAFWELVVATCGALELRPIGKTVGPAVAVELARSAGDFDRVLVELMRSDTRARKTAEDVLRQIVGAARAT